MVLDCWWLPHLPVLVPPPARRRLSLARRAPRLPDAHAATFSSSSSLLVHVDQDLSLESRSCASLPAIVGEHRGRTIAGPSVLLLVISILSPASNLSPAVGHLSDIDHGRRAKSQSTPSRHRPRNVSPSPTEQLATRLLCPGY